MSSSDARRIRLILEYDGTNYAGWQRQINAPSVQQTLEEKLSRLLGEHTCVTGSSRTDAGVHALCQNVHFDTTSRIPGDKFVFRLNTLLPGDIRVRESMDAPRGFHARFSATGKVYRYAIQNTRHAPAIDRLTHAHVPLPLDEARMDAAAQAMVGYHDFGAFAAAGSVVRDTRRTIYRVKVYRRSERVYLLVHGDGFLYNMVRILAGTLIGIGNGKLPPDALARAIETGDRLDLGMTAPAHGLTLLRVFYGDDEQAAKFFDT